MFCVFPHFLHYTIYYLLYQCVSIQPWSVSFLQNSFSDISNFDPEFTDEVVPNSVCWSQEHAIVNASVMEADDAFVGFSYAPPSDDSFL